MIKKASWLASQVSELTSSLQKVQRNALRRLDLKQLLNLILKMYFRNQEKDLKRTTIPESK